VSLKEAFKEVSPASSEVRSTKVFRNLLIIGETALALVLLIGAGLLYRSFLRVRGIDPGFKSSRILTLTVDLTLSKYPTSRAQANFFEQVIQRIKNLSGVQSVGGSDCPPLGNISNVEMGMALEGRSEKIPSSLVAKVSPDYFRTMAIPLKQGRYFDETDREGSPSVAIINESFARRYFPHESCLGRRVESWVHENDWLTIVGVVGDVRGWLEGEPDPEIYLPYLQVGEPYMTILLRTAGNPLQWAAAVRGQIASVDKDQPPHDLSTLDKLRESSFASRRINLLLLGASTAWFPIR
jgi:putative ABC transport system permease protein